MLSLLKRVHLFNGLSDEELEQVASLCTVVKVPSDELVVEQNTTGEEIYFISEGVIEVFVKGLDDERTVIVLGQGQVFGEMSMIGQGYRSASGRAGHEGCTMYMLDAQEFTKLCEQNTRIGYIVMRNLAMDMGFKLRHRNLAEM